MLRKRCLLKIHSVKIRILQKQFLSISTRRNNMDRCRNVLVNVPARSALLPLIIRVRLNRLFLLRRDRRISRQIRDTFVSRQCPVTLNRKRRPLKKLRSMGTLHVKRKKLQSYRAKVKVRRVAAARPFLSVLNRLKNLTRRNNSLWVPLALRRSQFVWRKEKAKLALCLTMKKNRNALLVPPTCRRNKRGKKEEHTSQLPFRRLAPHRR